MTARDGHGDLPPLGQVISIPEALAGRRHDCLLEKCDRRGHSRLRRIADYFCNCGETLGYGRVLVFHQVDDGWGRYLHLGCWVAAESAALVEDGR